MFGLLFLVIVVLLVYCFTVCLLRFWCVMLIVSGLLITLVCLGWLVGLIVVGCFVVSGELFVVMLVCCYDCLWFIVVLVGFDCAWLGGGLGVCCLRLVFGSEFVGFCLNCLLWCLCYIVVVLWGWWLLVRWFGLRCLVLLCYL